MCKLGSSSRGNQAAARSRKQSDYINSGNLLTSAATLRVSGKHRTTDVSGTRYICGFVHPTICIGYVAQPDNVQYQVKDVINVAQKESNYSVASRQ